MNRILELKNKDRKTGQEKVVGKIEIKNELENRADLFFYGDICSSTWGCWEDEDKCPQDVADFLKDLDNNKEINIYINSGGGSVFAGLAIYNQLKRHPANKTVYVDGLAASISSVIALAGDKVIIPKNAQFMIHKPWSWAIGNANDLRKTADSLDSCEQSILNVYEENLKDGVDIETIKQFVNDETWFTGEEAAKYFNIDVEEESELVACNSEYFEKYKNIPIDLFKNDNKKIKNNLEKKELQTRLRIAKAMM
ncbi:head maturation protease, ClpP-related (plasmid) [Clostridium perfringens]|nr:head maturation protease, ClpP-related [Clostridium perfringens]EHA6441888.1 Clp protease ClpP [Clostridium perfringens]MBI6033746.1 Clp protease ClpP [Clostridium perfringens]UUR88576.1 Clp protease ClpP [Clostridium perfringens]